ARARASRARHRHHRRAPRRERHPGPPRRRVMSDLIQVERDDSIATVVFNRPKMRNAISLAMWAEIASVTNELAVDEAVRAIVYRGAGRQAFASGADISEFQENRDRKS